MSYAHADEAIAARLHKALETYRIPKTLALNADRKLTPIFRDTAELTAHHDLSEKIREAVNTSRYLIVLCSPAAKSSHWVNEEVRLFRKVHGDPAILCVLADGTPATSFPPALTDGGREPLAANLAGGRENFRLGVTQLAASMLGVGLDALIQRDSQRRRNKLWLLTASSILFSAVMGGMAFTALKAQNAAELSRSEAEKMVEFMLTDLRRDLDPIGKLDILDNVGKRVADYYDAIPTADMDDDRYAREARARHLLGQVAIDQRRMDKAEVEIQAAHRATRQVLKRNPNDTDAIFAHAQSDYWVGELHYRQKEYSETLPYWTSYNALARQLYAQDEKRIDWLMEAAWGQGNLGSVSNKLKEYPAALAYFEKANDYFDLALNQRPDAPTILREKANALHGAAWAAFNSGARKKSIEYMADTVALYEDLLSASKNDFTLRHDLVHAKIDLSVFKPTYQYNALQDLKNLTAHDSQNIVWLQNLRNNAYIYAFRASLGNDSAGFSNYAREFFNAHTKLAQIEGYETSRSGQIKPAIITTMQSYHENRKEQAQRELKHTALELLKTPAENTEDSGLHFDLICLSHKLGNENLTHDLIESYAALDFIINEMNHPTILQNKLTIAAYQMSQTDVETLTSSLTSKGYSLDELRLNCLKTK